MKLWLCIWCIRRNWGGERVTWGREGILGIPALYPRFLVLRTGQMVVPKLMGCDLQGQLEAGYFPLCGVVLQQLQRQCQSDCIVSRTKVLLPYLWNSTGVRQGAGGGSQHPLLASPLLQTAPFSNCDPL